MGKLPYIENKKMYAAVMGACSYVRATGYFNKATSYYADKYGVDVEEVRRYVRIAQGNGQKRAAKRKYKWYVMVVMRDFYCAGDCGEYDSWNWGEKEKREHTRVVIRKSTSEENARRQMDITKSMPTWALFERPHDENRVFSAREFESEEAAQKFADSLTWKSVRDIVLCR
jgi:hypothetical protein